MRRKSNAEIQKNKEDFFAGKRLSGQTAKNDENTIKLSQEMEIFVSIKINATEDVLEILSLLQSYNFYI